MKTTLKCYKCDAEGVTKEHAPPDSFFPKGYRDNLVTVPSCHDHNTKNSKDVEYVRNVIVTHISTNEAAREHFQNKVIRSFENSSKLFNRTFKNVRLITLNGEETGVFNFDLPRFKLVMNAIAHAIFYKDFGKTYPRDWGIISSSLLSSSTLYEGIPDNWEEYRNQLNQIQYTEMATPQPEIFRYGVKKWSDEEVIYRFLFYEGFMVEALALLHPDDQA